MRKPARVTLATKTSIATSLLFLVTILAIGMAALQSFRQQMWNVMVADQNTLVVRIADNLDQKLLTLQTALKLSASEITAPDLESSDAAQHYLDTTTGLSWVAYANPVLRARIEPLVLEFLGGR